MRTRNLTIIIQNNEVKLATYGESYGYLSALGWGIISFLQNKEAVLALKEYLSRNRLKNFNNIFDDEDFKVLMKEKNLEFEDIPTVSCDCTGDELFYILLDINHIKSFSILQNHYLKKYCEQNKVVEQKFGFVPIPYRYDFVRDSLFNEYTYVIDFDNNNLEIYKGLNNKPLESKPEERFYKEQFDKDGKLINDGGYYPVQHWFTLSFNEINSLTFKDIFKIERSYLNIEQNNEKYENN